MTATMTRPATVEHSTVEREVSENGARLATLIERGLALGNLWEIDQDKDLAVDMCEGIYEGCALFLALAGKLGSAEDAYHICDNPEFDDPSTFAEHLGIGEDLADKVVDGFSSYRVAARTIVSQLRDGTFFCD